MNIFADCPEGLPELFAGVRLGIAGCGGIGSNAAFMLARSGATRLTVADFDRVEPRNLNRQFFFADQVGNSKALALRDNLRRINPGITVDSHDVRITPENTGEIFGGCDILIEAFDDAGAKAMLIEEWSSLFPDRLMVACSGIAGTGMHCRIVTRRTGNLFIVGDGKSDISEGTFSPRVLSVASGMVTEIYHFLAGTICGNGCCSLPLSTKPRLFSSGKEVPLSGFPGKMIEGTVRGMLGTLKGIDPEGPVVLELP